MPKQNAKREVIATFRSSNGKKHYDITRKPSGALDCSCLSQRYRKFRKGFTCCKHLAELGVSA